MLHLDIGVAESLDALLEELERQMGLVDGEPLTDGLDKDGVV